MLQIFCDKVKSERVHDNCIEEYFRYNLTAFLAFMWNSMGVVAARNFTNVRILQFFFEV